MKKLLTATATAVALATAGTAGAADLPVKAPPMPPPPVATWTGCYLSGGVGYGMWNQDHFLFDAPAGNFQLTPQETAGGRGWLGRVGGGCDYQFNGNFVVGVFGDYDFKDIHSHDFANLGAEIGANEKESSSWAVGGRVGYLPYDNLLTFISGGWTEARFDRMDLFAAINPPVSLNAFIDGHTYSGWFIGGGYEYRLPWWQSVTWKTEYRFAEYGHDNLTIWVDDPRRGIVDSGLRLHSEKFEQTVTTSLVWRFNFWGGGPAYGRY